MSSASTAPKTEQPQQQAAQPNKQANITPVPKKDENGKAIPGSCDGTLVRIRLFDDRERVLFFQVNSSMKMQKFFY